MKKIFLAALSILAAAILAAGCSGAAERSDIGLLDSKYLQVGMEIGYPPFEFFADDGTTPIGHDVDLAHAIAGILGVEVKLIDTAWEGIFSGLDIDKYDVIISAVTINAERMKTMEFSDPYIENWQAIAVRRDTPPVTSYLAMNGLRIGYQDATMSSEWLDELIETGQLNCERSAYDKVIYAFEDLRLGRVDAVLTDSTVAEGYVGREPNVFEISWHQKDEPGAEPESFGIAIKKGNTVLVEAINDAIKQLEANGKKSEIYRNWFD
ncbi:MAG: transporter substrate-binding domain-containing protein [Defluviitaleaceae bacterium]|nr:transporter substrate-binding domain-containing protein [Defluviitaleaceae bacterium]